MPPRACNLAALPAARRAAALLLAVLWVAPAAAQDAGSPSGAPSGARDGDGPIPGCYLRDYSADHLRRHPDQVVDVIRLHVTRDEYGDAVAHMRVRFADQGHTAISGHGGQVLDQFLICWSDAGRTACAVECDGGTMDVTRDDGTTLVFSTDQLWVGQMDSCGGLVNLAEKPGQSVSYRLDRTDDSACSGD